MTFAGIIYRKCTCAASPEPHAHHDAHTIITWTAVEKLTADFCEECVYPNQEMQRDDQGRECHTKCLTGEPGWMRDDERGDEESAD